MQDKTWKREVAFLMFLHIVWITVYASNPVGLLQVLIFPYIAFILAAFGLDAVLKQGNFSFSRKEQNG